MSKSRRCGTCAHAIRAHNGPATAGGRRPCRFCNCADFTEPRTFADVLAAGEAIATLEERTTRSVGYARVSTTAQTSRQQVDALELAGCVEVFVDDGISGSTTSRPELDRCLDALEPGDLLAVWKLDRLGRSLSHLVGTVEALGVRGVGFRSLTENIDTSSASGRLILGIFASIAQFERDLIRERTNAAIGAKKRRGERLGRRPSLTLTQVGEAKAMLDRGESPAYVARILRVNRSTLWRTLQRSA